MISKVVSPIAMGRIILAVFGVLLLLSSSLVYNVEAQSVLPDIEIECGLEEHIDVFKGSSQSGYFVCTLSNPTTLSEEVEVTIESGVLLAAGPGTVTVGPGADVDFMVSLRAESGMMAQTIPVETKAVVVSWNGLPADSLPEASDTAETMVTIMEYSSPTIELIDSEITVTAGSDFEMSVIYGNRGNGLFDKIKIGVSDPSRGALEDIGFTISAPVQAIEIESGDTKVIVFKLRAPKGVNDEEYFTIEFYGESDFSCRSELSGCNRVYMMSTIRVLEDTTDEGVMSSLGEPTIVVFGAIGGGLLVVAAVIVVLKRKNKSDTVGHELDDGFDEDFEDDDFEEDLDDEFEDDIEDDFFDDL